MGKVVNNKPAEERITIDRIRYEDLLNTEAKMEALEIMGVDNWQGYDDAMDEYRKNQDWNK